MGAVAAMSTTAKRRWWRGPWWPTMVQVTIPTTNMVVVLVDPATSFVPTTDKPRPWQQKGVMVMATRVASNKEGEGDSNGNNVVNGNGNDGGGQATALRVI
jgi:hypothetical protein